MYYFHMRTTQFSPPLRSSKAHRVEYLPISRQPTCALKQNRSPPKGGNLSLWDGIIVKFKFTEQLSIRVRNLIRVLKLCSFMDNQRKYSHTYSDIDKNI